MNSHTCRSACNFCMLLQAELYPSRASFVVPASYFILWFPTETSSRPVSCPNKAANREKFFATMSWHHTHEGENLEGVTSHLHIGVSFDERKQVLST
eukprot:756044-Hanusia_phi.AAC.5